MTLHGMAAGVQRGLMRRAERYAGAQLYRLLSRPLGRDPAAAPAAAAPPAGFQLWELGLREVLARCAYGIAGLRRDAVRAAFARGEACVGALHGDALAGYVWFAFEAAPHVDGAWATFAPRAVYAYKLFVAEAWRGRGLARALLRHEGGLAGRGREEVITCIALHNLPSLAAARAAGFTARGHVAILQWGKRLLLARTPGAARAGFRFGASRAASPAPSDRPA